MNGAKRHNTGYLRALLRNVQGNVLPIAAIGMLLAAALVGGGIDMSRAYRVKNRLQSACDSATLAGRRAVTTNGYADGGPEQTQANGYFRTNFDDSSMETSNTSFLSSTPDNGNTVTGSASTKLNLAVMKIFGFQTFSLSVSCQASMGVGNSDVMMVLDTTGSMTSALDGGTRISALRTAMKNFYTTVKNASNGTNARIRYGFVPFSTTVNVGKLLYDLNPSYLQSTYTIQSRIVVSDTGAGTSDINSTDGPTSDYGSTSYGNNSDCTAALPSPTAWTNTGTVASNKVSGDPDGSWVVSGTATQQQRTVYDCYRKKKNDYRIEQYTQTQDHATGNTYYRWDYKPISYDVSSYKAFGAVSTNTGPYGAAVSSTWSGCIEERGTTAASTFSYSTSTGITPSAAQDLDVDTAPTATANTKWGMMWPEVAWYRSGTASPTTTGYKPSSICPYKAQLLAEMNQTDFNAYADAMTANGSTYLDIGMTWGGRLLSPTGIFSGNVTLAPSNGGEVSRHLIFMTDGTMDTSGSVQSAWGMEQTDRRVTTDGSDSAGDSRHTSRFRAVCDEIKAKGIRIWTISFTAGSNTDLSYCASPNSYYNATDSAALNTAFQEIAKQVGELRLTQ